MSQQSRPRSLFLALFSGIILIGLLVVLKGGVAGVPALGDLLEPADGLYRTARLAEHPAEATVDLPGLAAPVTVIRDERGVPHIFADSDADAIMAAGYVVAQDRLFQLDFIPRVAAGRLAEAFGAAAVENDRFLRRTGMAWGAQKSMAAYTENETEAFQLLTRFAEGVNAYIESLDEGALPLEFRLLGYQPDRYTPEHTLLLLQYMTYDLTYRTDAAYYSDLRNALGAEDYALLYPQYANLAVPIIPDDEVAADRVPPTQVPAADVPGRAALGALAASQEALQGTFAEGFIDGKGSNNWAVAGSRSTTGAPILAGDMHLQLTLPAIWYELHLVTPTMNSYGVTVPGAPFPVEAFNDRLAWAFTNTGSDQIDHLGLTLDDTGLRYRYDGGWRDLDVVIDTIHVNGGTPVVDTLYYSHWGPVTLADGEAVALRWVAHDPSRTLDALLGMNRARDLASFNEALRQWDTPMQNILYGDVDGTIAIRSTGYLPIRQSGTGVGLLDGSTDAHAWVGRVPFDELPHAVNPAQGFLTSTNQMPAGPDYPHYLGHDWRAVYRSIRIDQLMRSKAQHSVDDLKAYQADVRAMQRDFFVPLLDTLSDLSIEAAALRAQLVGWDGTASVDRPEPLILYEFMRLLGETTWDEVAFEQGRRPTSARLFLVLRDYPDHALLDVQATPEREDAAALLRQVLEATAEHMAAEYGADVAAWRWDDHHKLELQHLTRSPALNALWRSDLSYPGFSETLSPAGGRVTRHSASWRVVVDLSQQPPLGYGVYPGGQSGNPFSPHYDLHVQPFIDFQHYSLYKPAALSDVDPDRAAARLTLVP